MGNVTIKDVEHLIKHPSTTLGGYDCFGITQDGEPLCGKCIESNFECIKSAMTDNDDPQWIITAIDNLSNYDYWDSVQEAERHGYFPLQCTHCYKFINCEDEPVGHDPNLGQA